MAASKPPAAGGAVPVKIRFDSADSFVAAYLESPALGGLYIATSVAVPIGTRIDLTVDFGGGKGLRGLAEVAGHQKSGAGALRVGVRFIKLDPAYRKWLDARVAKANTTKGGAATTPTHQLRKAQSARELDDSGLKLGGISIEGRAEDIMGIDLGTCNSCACVFLEGKPVIVDLSDGGPAHGTGERGLPSVVSFDDDGKAMVGTAAKTHMTGNARRTIFGAKRFIGRRYDSPAVQSMLSHFPYKVVPGAEGKVSIDINGRSLNLTAVSAKVLDAIRKKVDERLGRTIDRAIITVPAYYNDNQRNAVIAAGRLAGLTVERVVNEPTAAAIAYGLLRSKPRRLLVYDLGGGTFDVSVMTVHRDSLQVLATAGDTFLGGEDFDEVLLSYAIEEFEKKNRKLKLSRNSAALGPVKAAVEKAKVRLSSVETTTVAVREAVLTNGSTARMEVEVSQAEYKNRIEPLVARTLKICDMALREARLGIPDLGDVILVGGQSRMPYVQERVRQHFKMAPRSDINPDEVVALGAGILAQLSTTEQDKLTDVLSMTIGVAAGNTFKPIIPRNTELPHAKGFKISVRIEEWQDYRLDLWQGDSSKLHQNEFLGSLKVDTLDPGHHNPVPVRVDLALTPDCLLKVRITNLTTEERKSVLLETRDH